MSGKALTIVALIILTASALWYSIQPTTEVQTEIDAVGGQQNERPKKGDTPKSRLLNVKREGEPNSVKTANNDDFTELEFRTVKEVLEELPFPGISGYGTKIHSRMRKLLRISESEEAEISTVTTHCIDRLKQIEKRVKRFENSEELGNFYIIPKSTEAASLSDDLRQNIKNILGERRGAIFADALARSDVFNNFLQSDTVFFLEEIKDSAGQPSLHLVRNYLRETGEESEDSRQLLNDDIIQRYDSIFDSKQK